MTITIPSSAQFVTVEFSRPEGGTHKQRVTVVQGPNARAMFGTKVSDLVAAAVKGCKRKKVNVANVQRITHGKAVLFDYVSDTTEMFR